MLWKELLLVAVGGALGAVARFSLSMLPRMAFPWHTLAANLAGSFAIGMFLLANTPSETGRLWFAVGFLGAFTTMSAYSMETISLWREEKVGVAVTNILANGLGGPLMALLGWKLS